MKLIYIHGAPATGKLTVALALREMIPCTIFDNHAAIDTARAKFNFGEAGFWELVQATRICDLTDAAKQGEPVVIMTSCFSHPEDLPQLVRFESVVSSNRGHFLPVFLHCSEKEKIKRVGNSDRVERQKISSKGGLKQFASQYNISPVPRESCLTLDSETHTAQETACKIINHFRLI